MSRTSKKDTDSTDLKGVAGTAGGGTAGALAGAGIGAIAGGPVGAAVGAAIGAVAGAAGGAAIDYESYRDEFQQDWETNRFGKTTSWEEAEPAYKFGWETQTLSDSGAHSWEDVRSDISKKWKGGSWSQYEPMVRKGWLARAQSQLNAGGEAVVPIVEEDVEVGKRKVKKGSVQVETRVVEKPVEAQVHLHDEKVKVHRRAVDRNIEPGDLHAFEEGTIEVDETAEEPIVSKNAKVVEEVVIRKEGQDRTETVRDKARRTDVNVHSSEGTEIVSETPKSKKK